MERPTRTAPEVPGGLAKRRVAETRPAKALPTHGQRLRWRLSLEALDKSHLPRKSDMAYAAFEAYGVLWDSLLRERRRFALPCDAPLMR